MRRILVGLVGVALVLGTAEHAFSVDVQPEDLGTLGGPRARAWKVNNRGQVVGNAETPGGAFRAFLWQDSVIGDLGLGEGSAALDMNESGDVVGSWFVVGDVHGFLWSRGEVTDLGLFFPRAIKDRGEIAGRMRVGGADRAFLWRHGSR